MHLKDVDRSYGSISGLITAKLHSYRDSTITFSQKKWNDIWLEWNFEVDSEG